MEPISTLILTAAFLAPVTATRRLTWETSTENDSKIIYVTADTITILLPGDIVSPTTDKLIEIETSPVLSARELLKRETESYAHLTLGWNGPGSVAPTRKAMDMAQLFIDSIPARLPLPRPMVSSNGEVALYRDLEGGYAEVSFETEGQAFFFSRNADGKEHFEEQLGVGLIDENWFWKTVGSPDVPLKHAA